MNIYLVVSEEMWETVPILDDGTGPSEPYCIVELVNARSNAQAKYLAWRKDKHNYSNYDIEEMPKFRSEMKVKNSGIEEPCILSDKKDYARREELWGFKDEREREGLTDESEVRK